MIQLHKNKDGGIGYKQLLFNSNNSTPHQLVTFSPEGITEKNYQPDNQVFHSYDNIKYVMESENLLVLVNNIRLGLIIDKRTLVGGSKEEFLAFLREHCPQMNKRVKKGRLGRFMIGTMCVLIILGCILSFATLLHIPEKISGQLTNDMTYQEMVDELTPLGISICQQTINELEALDIEYLENHGNEYYHDNYDQSKIYDLLYWEAAGFYDQETWEWTPSTSGIFWFDAEVTNVDSIYSDFLTGISAMHEELHIVNVQEDYSNVNFESGTGTVAFSFDWNGTHYELEAEFYQDWFDTNVLLELCGIIAADACEKNLYFTFDDGQGYLLYYGNLEQLKQLERISGLDFSAP